MAKLDIIKSTTQNVVPMISLMTESIWSGVHLIFVPPRLKISSRHQLVGASAGHRAGWSLAFRLCPVLIVLARVSETVFAAD